MFRFSDIKSYHAALINGSITCEEIVSSYLEKITQNKHLNAFTEVYEVEALDHAKALDEKRKSGNPLGKLHGVVVALKDVISYKGHEVTAASCMLKGFKSLYNAKAVQCLIDEDAIIIGNCNCDEFAMGSANENSAYGPVTNPWDVQRIPGGSSGGSAAAVAARLTPAATGTDTGGSIRQPASLCNLTGLKPTYGRISRWGMIAFASSLDQAGPMNLVKATASAAAFFFNRPRVSS